MTSASYTFTRTPGAAEIVITRLFDAPRERLFNAYVQPELVAQWQAWPLWTMTIEQMEVRVGGVWRYVLRDTINGMSGWMIYEQKKLTKIERPADAEPDEHIHHGVYHAVVPFERIVYTKESERVQLTPIAETSDGEKRYTFEKRRVRPKHVWIHSLTFDEQGSQTKLTHRLLIPSGEYLLPEAIPPEYYGSSRLAWESLAMMERTEAESLERLARLVEKS